MKPNRRGLDSAIAAGVVAAFRAYVLRLVFDPAALRQIRIPPNQGNAFFRGEVFAP